MADQDRRCLPPCQRQLSDEDLYAFCFECLGEEHAIRGLEGECKPCDILSFKALRTRLAFFKSSWGSRVYGGRNRGAAATKHTVSHWVRDAIAQAYEARGQASPLRVRAHSTRGVASSMALARGAPLQQVCDAAGWSSPHTFVRFYSLDVHATPGSHVLESTSQSHVWDHFNVCAHTTQRWGSRHFQCGGVGILVPIALSAQHRE